MKTYSFYGLPVSDVSKTSIYDFFKKAIIKNNNTVIYGYSLYAIYAIRKIPEIYTLGKQAALFLTDGRPFYWLCKIAKLPLTDGISIPECVMLALNFANEYGLKVMLIGATAKVNKEANENIRKKFKKAIILEGHHGYFNTIDEEAELIKKVNCEQPDILLVGISSPKKERFVFNNASALKAKIVIPCGGMIDVLAGKTKMTPRWLKRIGLASFYRVIQEPKRLLFDRLKMIWFLLVDFFPKFLINAVVRRKNFSIPALYIKEN